MSRHPAVSVIIPAYRAARYIGEALASVFAQTRTDYEVVLVNDGSPDTPELEAALEPYRPRLVYLSQTRAGVSAARNLAIRNAGGEFVAFLDGDDAWLPHCLAVQMEALASGAGLDMVWGDLELFGHVREPGRTLMAGHPSERPVTFESLIRLRSAPSTSSVLVRRSSVLAAGLFDERFSRSEDFDLWLRLARAGCRMDSHTAVVGRRRIHAASASYDRIAMLKAMIAVLDKLEAAGLAPEHAAAVEATRAGARAHCRYEEGRVCLRDGRYAEAADAIRDGIAFCGARKANLLLSGLRLAPRLTRLAFGVRDRLLRAG